ncbi:uncharacterized protein LOC115924532 [Strongylocentrotus purpuratus]|uniref:Uncharacterized protein n=1 Tax=Strongylocentrotus purpuratus TaxID=7668 RepID=A0A7M7NWZ1_STRPU|nr:uncharacterized protein LOC115924532 [Strongylocentrotus purpuratus]
MRVGLKKSKDLSEAVAVAIAAAQGNEQNVRGILKDHPDWVNSPCNEKSPLQLAVHGGFIDVTKFLIAAGADLDMTDEDGDTALMFAIYGNHPDIVKYLLSKGANINIVNKERRSALHQAVTRCYIECMRVLLAHHCDVNIQDNFGDTALHDAISGQSNPVLSLLLENGGINFKLSNKRQFNALQWAAMKGNQNAIQRILNIDPELAGLSNTDGRTALHIAARNNFEDIVRLLIVKGECSVDDYTVDRQTPLLLAVRAGHIETLEVLLKLWANVNLPDADGDTSLHVALLRQVIFPDVTETNLLEKIRSRIPDQSVATSGLALACLLVEYKADLCHVNNKGQTPLDIVPDTKIHAVLRHFVPAAGGSPGRLGDTESLETAPSIPGDGFDKLPRQNETDQERAQREKIEYYEGQLGGTRPDPEGRDNRFADSRPGVRGYGENRDEGTVAGDRKEPQSKVDGGGGAGARQEHIQLQQDKEKQCRLAPSWSMPGSEDVTVDPAHRHGDDDGSQTPAHIAKQQMEEMRISEDHQAASRDKPFADPAGDSASHRLEDNRGQIPEHITKQESQLLAHQQALRGPDAVTTARDDNQDRITGQDLDHIAMQTRKECQFNPASPQDPQDAPSPLRPPLPQLDLSPQQQRYPHRQPAPDTTPSPISIQSTPTPTSLIPNLARCRLIACGGIADAQFKPCGHTIVCYRCSQCFKLCHECKASTGITSVNK